MLIEKVVVSTENHLKINHYSVGLVFIWPLTQKGLFKYSNLSNVIKVKTD